MALFHIKHLGNMLRRVSNTDWPYHNPFCTLLRQQQQQQQQQLQQQQQQQQQQRPPYWYQHTLGERKGESQHSMSFSTPMSFHARTFEQLFCPFVLISWQLIHLIHDSTLQPLVIRVQTGQDWCVHLTCLHMYSLHVCRYGSDMFAQMRTTY